jgi:hypothetical protein
MIIKNPKNTHKAQYVDWEHMARKNDPIFNEVISNCERQRVKMLMGFRQDWNKEIIAQFCHIALLTHWFREGYELDSKWSEVFHHLP